MIKVKKYKVHHAAGILTVILAVICFFGYILCTFFLNTSLLPASESGIETVSYNIPVLYTLKDVMLTVTSILGTNLVLSILIDVNSKNAFLTEILENDVIAAPEFYEAMDEGTRVKMHDALEENLYFNYPMVHDMYKDIHGKLNSKVNSYYFESCEYVISCSVNDKYIEKEITKRVCIKSFEDNYTIHNFSVSNLSSREIEDGIEAFKIISLEINGEKVDISKDIDEKPNGIGNLDRQNKYNLSIGAVYNKPLPVSRTDETKIVVKCKTRTPIDDKISTFRVTKPCKKFSLIYDIKEHDKYRLSVDAFGFLDDADESVNSSFDSNINITFKDWIFEYDGVVVSILEKNN